VPRCPLVQPARPRQQGRAPRRSPSIDQLPPGPVSSRSPQFGCADQPPPRGPGRAALPRAACLPPTLNRSSS
jgi:hypothetical protein